MLETVLNKYKNLEIPIDINYIINNHGINIHKTDLGEVDGIFYKNTIGINNRLSKEKQRFTIAHEFCHFLLKETGFSKGIYHSKDLKEKRADDFATELLLPKEILLETYKEYGNIPTLSEIFGVPIKVVEMRLNNLLSK